MGCQCGCGSWCRSGVGSGCCSGSEIESIPRSGWWVVINLSLVLVSAGWC